MYISGVGNLSRVRLVEVKGLPAYLTKKNAGAEWTDQELDRPEVSAGIFALKVTRKTEVVRLKQAEHVKSEALILSQVTHPFIVNLYHRFQDERSLYLLEEFVQGGQLDRFIKTNGRLSNETARFYAAQVVMAMQVLHQEHVVYRDLNPSNILLDRGLYVKLVDFGLAKILNFDDPTARTWTLCGTPEYLAPEIISSKGHSKEVDWWALGIIIHEMLAGYPPWYHNEKYEIYKEILNHKISADSFPKHFETHRCVCGWRPLAAAFASRLPLPPPSFSHPACLVRLRAHSDVPGPAVICCAFCRAAEISSKSSSPRSARSASAAAKTERRTSRNTSGTAASTGRPSTIRPWSPRWSPAWSTCPLSRAPRM